ncbi:MAG: sulfatase-like hydrolase/transferase [Planctomycetaceae bacterium]|nr:sulfatase-like hydrolase/transferase [Planctomycetaceae bacterium]
MIRNLTDRHRTASLLVVWLTLVVGIRSAVRGDDSARKRPNILFIYADDQSYKTLSCYPESPDWVHTPNIDRLAQSGIRFERAYYGAWCMPSRASFLTGRLQHGVQTMSMEGQYPASTYDPQQCPFVPAHFRKAGYHTAQIGKWHTGVDTGYGRDWDYQIVWNRPGHPDNAGSYFYDQILTFNGEDRLTPGYSTDNYTNWAVDYIRGEHRDADKPWYLWLCYGAIHGPTTPADRHKGTLKEYDAEVPADIFGPWPEKPSYLEQTSAWIKGPDGKPAMKKKVRAASNFDTLEAGKSYRAWIQQVNECMLGVDEGVGRVMQALEESGQLANTLVIYTADHGHMIGHHGLYGKGNATTPQNFYEESIRVPLLMRWPAGGVQSQVVTQPVDLCDLFMTMLAVGEVALSPVETTLINSPGWSLLPLARGGAVDWRTVQCCEYGNARMITDLRYKLVHRYAPQADRYGDELFDLVSDPRETMNLIDMPENQDLIMMLDNQMTSYFERYGVGQKTGIHVLDLPMHNSFEPWRRSL